MTASDDATRVNGKTRSRESRAKREGLQWLGRLRVAPLGRLGAAPPCREMGYWIRVSA